MRIGARYVSAVVVNVALPWLAYRVGFMHGGIVWAHAAALLPLLGWLLWDLARHGHFDAMTAVVLVGTALSFVTVLVTSDVRERLVEEPLVSGMIGVVFLVSLLTRRPIVYYLGRSTMARESVARAAEFDAMWVSRLGFAARIRVMTLVWGWGLLVENLLRIGIVFGGGFPGEGRVGVVSGIVRYGFYGGLVGWTVWYRRRIRGFDVRG
jgi:hypothetical protein